MSTPTTVTVCQLDTRPQHRADALTALGRHAVDAGSDLVVLPEMPFSAWLAAERVPDADRWRAAVAEHEAALARLGELGVGAVVTSRPTVEPNGSRRNAAVVWAAATGAVRVRDKCYLPDEPGFWEASWYDRGEPSTATCRVGEARVAVPVCTDLWFLEAARQYARDGVDLYCLPRATPYASLDTWLAGGRVAAVCSGAYSLSSNRWEPDGAGLDCGGLGWVVDPDGRVLATTSADEPYVSVQVDLAAARAAKGTYPRYVGE